MSFLAVVLQEGVCPLRNPPRGHQRGVGPLVAMGRVQPHMWGRSLIFNPSLRQPQVARFLVPVIVLPARLNPLHTGHFDQISLQLCYLF